MLLAAVVLLSGTGFTVKKMICLSSGAVEVGLYSLDGCCAAEEQAEDDCTEQAAAEISDPGCCEFSSKSFFLAQDIVLKQNSVESIDFIALEPQSLYNFRLPVAAVKTEVLSYADLPPPLAGRDLLHFISVLTI